MDFGAVFPATGTGNDLIAIRDRALTVEAPRYVFGVAGERGLTAAALQTFMRVVRG